MTTPGGVPNLPIGALTTSTLGERLQDFTAQTVKDRAAERVPSIFSNSTGGDISSDLSPFGIITNIWSAVNSLIAGSDPVDIQGPEDIPPLLTDFIESLPVIGAFVQFFEALADVFNGDYDGNEETILALQSLIAPLWNFLKFLFENFLEDFITGDDSFLRHVFEWLGFFWELFGDIVETVLNPILELVKWAWEKLDAIVGGTADEILRLIVDGIEWVWVNIGEPVVRALGGLVESVAGLIDLDVLKGLIEQLAEFLGAFLNPQKFTDLLKRIIEFFAPLAPIGDLPASLSDLVNKIPLMETLVATITGKTKADGSSLDLTALGDWARGIERDAKGGLDAITEFGRRLLGGAFLPPPNGASDINLLLQGDFAELATIDAANGWTWDPTTTASGTGGSAKLVASGSAQNLYSTQSIAVQQGDRITMSGSIKTSGFTAAAGRSIGMSLVPWNGTSRVLSGGSPITVDFTPRTTASSGWTVIGGTYTVPAGVTSVQARLVATANSGAIIWYDDLSIKKKSEMGQDYVNNLIPAWRDIYFNATGTIANIFWDAVGLAIGGIKTLGDLANGAIEVDRGILFGDPDGGSTVVTEALPLTDIAVELGTAGSGGKMYKASGNANLSAGPGHFTFSSSFYSNSTGVTSDITASTTNGSFTVTHAGFYEVEVGFTTNASPGGGGAFNVAPAVVVGSTLNKVGGTAFGSYGFGLGGYARTAHSTFIVYLTAGQSVTAAYYNYFDAGINDFFQGGETNTYFSIAMLNRTQEG